MELILKLWMEDSPTQACSNSGYPSLLQLISSSQNQSQTGRCSGESLPLVEIIEAKNES